MAKLTYQEKVKLEKLFQMSGGFVLGFSNPSFKDFFNTTVEIDIEQEKYAANGTSKARRLRKFWELESDDVVGETLYQLILLAKEIPVSSMDDNLPENELVDYCFKVADRLKGNSIVENINAIQATNDDRDFVNIARIIRETIKRDEPQNALDRLHTYIMMLVRDLCGKHNIEYNKSETLNAIFGKYVKHLRSNNLIDSVMSVKILSTSISIVESFNEVRNDKSYSHANPVLNYNESILIFNNLTNLVRFITKIENEMSDTLKRESTSWDELPF